MKLKTQEITDIVWREKYRSEESEETIWDTHERVCRGVYKNDMNGDHFAEALQAMKNLEWCPAGRIHAGAGTGRKVTLINCYVSPTIEDSIVTESGEPNTMGIMQSLEVASLTQQMGGGIGMDFSTLRPKHALVRQRSTAASGPITFMDMWNTMCGTIMAAGNRRGAMMATLACDHPDVLEFIEVKHTPGRLTNFNISILVSDKFMRAVKEDAEWLLGFNKPRLDKQHVGEITQENGEIWYIYYKLPARELWEKITRSTYDYAEPGVIFIDRINVWNNLWYCEQIHATNPCGEQPLPPNGACNLGAINLAVMVKNPFTKDAHLKMDRIGEIAKIAMRFLDNVLDETYYPILEQRAESMDKRRTGLGITGLGNMLQQLGIRYGSNRAIETTRVVMRTIRDTAYYASINLAKERGSFPLFNRDEYMQGKFIQTLPDNLQKEISIHGIRNGVLLTIAPTGTTSIYYGNISSGLEPTFAWKYQRKMRQSDGSFKEFEQVEDYGYRLYKEVHGLTDEDDEEIMRVGLPNYMVATNDLTVQDHLVMQAVCQEFIDSSISKTINCPKEITYEDFKGVYIAAYGMGLKGCTTYRPSEISEKVRGSILSVDTPKDQTQLSPIVKRPVELQGRTYKVKWPPSEHAYYITINNYVDENSNSHPFEVFINTKDASHQEWIMALTRSISAIFRRGGDFMFIIKELQEVHSSLGGAWVGKKYVPSLVALIGSVLEDHLRKYHNSILGLSSPNEKILNTISETILVAAQKATDPPTIIRTDDFENIVGEQCPQCTAPALVSKEGCQTCLSCGFSNCG